MLLEKRGDRVVLPERILRLLEEKQYSVLREALLMPSADLAFLFAVLPEEVRPLLFRLLPKEEAALLFVEMDSAMRESLLNGFSDAEIKTIMDELYNDDAADVLEEMPASVVERLLRQAEPEKRQSINELLKYPPTSAGSIMTTEFVAFKEGFTVRDALEEIRKSGIRRETVYTCYVTDEEKRLVGYVGAKTLLISDEGVKVGELMEKNVRFAYTLDDREQTAQAIEKYGFLALPVCDGEGRLVGIVTVDDAIDVLREEAEEDIAILSAVTPEDKPYLRRSVWELYRARIPWLLLLMLSATITGAIISAFEEALAHMVILTVFIPMLMGTGGNAGGQSSVTAIRALSLQEIGFSDLLAVVGKELRVALLAGLTLGIVNALKMLLIDRLAVAVIAAVSLSLAAVVVLAKLVGCVLPLLAKRIGLDPAVMAGPFVTTAVDSLALLIYFTLASALLPI